MTLSSKDPEPAEGSVVIDAFGRRWERHDGIFGGPGAANWTHDSEVESWVKVAGNYGPVQRDSGARP